MTPHLIKLRDELADSYIGGPANDAYLASQQGFRNGFDYCAEILLPLLKDCEAALKNDFDPDLTEQALAKLKNLEGGE